VFPGIAVKGGVMGFLLPGRQAQGPKSASGIPLCRRDGHVLVVPGLRVQSPTLLDISIAMAAASDGQAQHWLGWRRESIVPEPDRHRLLRATPEQGKLPEPEAEDGHELVAVDPELGRLVGYVTCDARSNEIGGWLAPQFRGRGLGTVLFACAAELGHRHLGRSTVTAGTESGNKACIGALTAAGFTPMPGPETYTLPNGRQIASSWFRHDSDRPTRCSG
jgi:RimJ/RimL family protein N-acetyltransferase